LRKTGPHHHGGLETVIYVLNGVAQLRWGERLAFEAEAAVGDFIYVPPYVSHQEINPSPDYSCSACWHAAARRASYSTWISKMSRRLSWSDGSTTCMSDIYDDPFWPCHVSVETCGKHPEMNA
jgi:oxalate decarboxylase/phosphoglucose isomerase-like protein (cupin superfamily)